MQVYLQTSTLLMKMKDTILLIVNEVSLPKLQSSFHAQKFLAAHLVEA